MKILLLTLLFAIIVASRSVMIFTLYYLMFYMEDQEGQDDQYETQPNDEDIFR